MSVNSEISTFYPKGTKENDRATTIVYALEGLTIEEALSMLTLCQLAIKKGIFSVN